MIGRIKKVENFGSFTKFEWSSKITDFKKFNFFFGWNYSGKTTLSRIFRSIEKKELPNDFSDAKFTIEFSDDSSISEKQLANCVTVVKVFNEDFIEDNFKWNDENSEIDPVFIIGEGSIKLNEELEKKNKQKSNLEKEKGERESEKSGKEREKERLLTSKASEIRNILNITNPREFDRNTLENNIGKISNSTDKFLRSNEEVQKLLNAYRSPKLDQIKETTIPPLNLKDFTKEVKNLLYKTVAVQKVIEKLKDNPKLSNWVKDGLELHKEEKQCQFCGNQLSEKRLQELNQHFSKEYDDFIKEINELKFKIESHKKEIDKIILPDEMRFYEDSRDTYKQSGQKFEEFKQYYLENLELLLSDIERKKENVFSSIELNKQIQLEIEEKIKDELKVINETIQAHNSTSQKLDQKKEQAKKELISHYVADFLEKSDYLKLENEINKLQKDIEKISNKLKEIENEIKEVESKIDEVTIGAQKINEYLKMFFGNDKLRVEKTENKKYKLYRNDKLAKYLSTGERNIISLVYFFTTLEDKNINQSETIILIDDPVSSLDYNHMHGVYAFLANKIKSFKQVFITTHNFEFFNLLKDMNKYDLNNDGNFYFIRKINKQENYISTIENIPPLLLKFKSEYNYLFSLIFNFNNSNDKQNFEELFILPNVLRRFFELYLFTKYPDGKKFKDKAQKFLLDVEDPRKRALLKLMDEHSHEQNLSHTQIFPDVNELESIINFFLGNLEKKDKDHFNALRESLSD